MTDSTLSRTAAEALLDRLRAAGVEHLLANAGTDFPPIIEAYGRLGETNLSLPTPLVIPHESVAMGMAHGYYLASGKPLAVMVHVNVGLANCVMGLINANAENIPVILMSGRTPLTEHNRHGHRTTPIHWNQEMYDQHALVRESVKWDYELRFPEQSRMLIERAMTVALSDPTGPVYLSLPREPLADLTTVGPDQDGAISPSKAGPPAAEAVERAADLLAAAERPLLIATRSATHGGFGPLPEFAEQLALPVVEFWPTRNAMPTGHKLHAGFDPKPWLTDADVVVVLESLVPWIRGQVDLPADCKIIAIGYDPLHRRVPVRSFPVDVNLAGDPAVAIAALSARLAERGKPDAATVAARAEHIAARHDALVVERKKEVAAGRTTPMSPAYVSDAIKKRVGDDALIFGELGIDPSAIDADQPGSLYINPPSGGLGWSLPAAMGARLADRSRLTVATMGDGSYIFSNPVACHQVAAMHDLPVLAIVFNNGVWNAVRGSTLAMYPDSEAAAANVMPLTSLGPSPDYAAVARAHGAHAVKAEDPATFETALDEAVRVVRDEGRQALIDVTVAY